MKMHYASKHGMKVETGEISKSFIAVESDAKVELTSIDKHVYNIYAAQD